MTHFQTIYEEALFREGDEAVLKANLPVPKNRNELLALDNCFYLSVMSRRIFRAGHIRNIPDFTNGVISLN